MASKRRVWRFSSAINRIVTSGERLTPDRSIIFQLFVWSKDGRVPDFASACLHDAYETVTDYRELFAAASYEAEGWQIFDASASKGLGIGIAEVRLEYGGRVIDSERINFYGHRRPRGWRYSNIGERFLDWVEKSVRRGFFSEFKALQRRVGKSLDDFLP